MSFLSVPLFSWSISTHDLTVFDSALLPSSLAMSFTLPTFLLVVTRHLPARLLLEPLLSWLPIMTVPGGIIKVEVLLMCLWLRWWTCGYLPMHSYHPDISDASGRYHLRIFTDQAMVQARWCAIVWAFRCYVSFQTWNFTTSPLVPSLPCICLSSPIFSYQPVSSIIQTWVYNIIPISTW